MGPKGRGDVFNLGAGALGAHGKVIIYKRDVAWPISHSAY